MIKPLTLVALAGALGSPSFADQLKSGVAMSPELVPAVSRPFVYGDRGAGDLLDSGSNMLAGESGVQLYYVGHKHHREGGEGGEGGKGRKRKKGHRRHHHHDYPPVYTHLPPIEIACGSKEFVGTLLGAVIGGILGSEIAKGDDRVVAVAAGTFLGAFLGREIGAHLDVTDEGCAWDAGQRAGEAPLGTEISWNNPETGHYGTVTPVRQGRDTAGRYCREYQQTVTIGGRVEEAYGTACRQPDGSWQIVE